MSCASFLTLTLSITLLSFTSFLCPQHSLAGTPAEERALDAAPAFVHYFKALESTLKERRYLVELAQLSLIAKEHLLLMGPPGNAKSKFSDMVLGHIVDENTGDRSYFKLQMTPETTLSETHGPLDYKKLTETNSYQRIYAEGMLLSRNVFIDEIFDGRANALRNVLGLLNERAHAQGPRIEIGKIETAFAATNSYISEVYERSGDDRPKALLDRFALSAFIPGDFDNLESVLYLIMSSKRAEEKLPLLTFQQLDAIRELVPGVEIPDSVGKFLAVLRNHLKEELETLEQNALKTYRDTLKKGEEAKPPYRSTKYHSLRSLEKASGILKAIVVQDWIVKGGARKLEADLEDVKKLELFFTLNGPDTDFVNSLLAKSVHPHEKAQLEAILQERNVFKKFYSQILTQKNLVSDPFRLAIADLEKQRNGRLTYIQKQFHAKNLLKLSYALQKGKKKTQKLAEFSGGDLGIEEVEDWISDSLLRLFDGTLENIDGFIKDGIKSFHLQELAEETEREAALKAKALATEQAQALELKNKMLSMTPTQLESKLVKRFDLELPNFSGLLADIVRTAPDSADVLYFNRGSNTLHRAEYRTSSSSVSPSSALSSDIFKAKPFLVAQSSVSPSAMLLPGKGKVIFLWETSAKVYDYITQKLEQDFLLLCPFFDFTSTLNFERDSIVTLDIKNAKLIQQNWNNPTQFKRLNLMSSTDRITDVLSKFKVGKDLIVVAANRNIYFTTQGLKDLYEIDRAGQVLHVGSYPDEDFKFKPNYQSELPSKILGFKYINSNLDSIIQIDLNTFAGEISNINIPNVNAGCDIFQNSLFIHGSSTEGLKLTQLSTSNTKVKAFQSYGNSMNPRDLGRGRIGYLQNCGNACKDYSYTILHLKDQ